MILKKEKTELKGDCSPSKVVLSKFLPIVSTFLRHEKENEKSNKENEALAKIDHCSNLELEDKKSSLTNDANANSVIIGSMETCSVINRNKEEIQNEKEKTILLEEEKQTLKNKIIDNVDEKNINSVIKTDKKIGVIGQEDKNEDECKNSSIIPCVHLKKELKDEEDLNRDNSHHQAVLKNETPPITPSREEDENVKIMKRKSNLFRTFSQFATTLFNSENETEDDSVIKLDKVKDDEVREHKEEWIVLDKNSIENDIVNFCLENETLSSSLSVEKTEL